MALNTYSEFYIKQNYRSCTHAQIAERLNKKPKTVSEYLRKRGLKKCPNYTEMEIYMLANFSVKHCANFITHKSINALKIKKWRINKAILASESIK